MISKNILKTLFLIIIISFIHLFSIHLTTYLENNIRLEKIKTALKDNKKIIELNRFTYEDYIHGEATPTPNTICEERYKLFYKIPNNYKIKIKQDELR